MSLRDAMAGIKEAHEPLQPTQTSKPKPQPIRKTQAKPQQTTKPAAKSSNPDYQPLKIFVDKELRRKVQRKFEDVGGRDLSDLVEKLFSEYLST